ncbi:MAG TPA: hypothetical protein VNF06_02490 [Candidatus Aquilonibacter sp.]|nr:hypothetical protein [Candidatus Aquilonibacter sp.]
MKFANNDHKGRQVRDASGNLSNLVPFSPRSISDEKLVEVAQDISVLFAKAFHNTEGASTEWTPQKVLARIREISFGMLVEQEGTSKKVGYAIFETPTCELGNILFINSIGFAQQGSGLGQVVIKEALAMAGSKIIAGRTQNPNLIKMLRRLNPTSILPIDEDYDASNSNKIILSALRDKTDELKNATIDTKSGVCKKVYRRGRLGNYPVNREDPEIAKIQERFEQIGMNQDEGDALIVAAKLAFI